MVAKATKVGSLYQLGYLPNHERASFAENADTKEDIWHKRLGGLQKLAKEKLVVGFDFDASKELTFCESCPQGKQHRTKFSSSTRRAEEPLGLVHSDLCGKMNEKSIGGTVSLIDDQTRYAGCTF